MTASIHVPALSHMRTFANAKPLLEQPGMTRAAYAVCYTLAHWYWIFGVIGVGQPWSRPITHAVVCCSRYRYWVRPAWLGALLNGRRMPSSETALRDSRQPT